MGSGKTATLNSSAMRTALPLLAALLTGIAASAQVTTVPLDLSLVNGFPYYYSTPSHDVTWVGMQGVNPTPWGFVDSKIVARTIDAGETWSLDTVPDPEERGVTSVFALGADTAWVGLSNINNGQGAIWKTTDGGASWVQQTTTEFSSSTSWFTQVHFFDASHGLAIGDPDEDGYWEIYTTDDGGAAWDRVPVDELPTPETGEWGMYNECASSGDSFWMPTVAGNVIYTTDRGASWMVSDVFPGTFNYFTVRFHDAMNGIAHQYSSAAPVKVTNDGGVTWTSQPLFPPLAVENISLIPGVSDAYIFKAEDPAKLYVTTDNFQSYTLIDDVHDFRPWPLRMADATLGWTAYPIINSAEGMYRIADIVSGAGDMVAEEVTSLGAFPNPVVSNATVLTFTLKEASVVELVLRSSDGRVVQRASISGKAGANAVVQQMHVPEGNYLLSVQGRSGVNTIRVNVADRQ